MFSRQLKHDIAETMYGTGVQMRLGLFKGENGVAPMFTEPAKEADRGKALNPVSLCFQSCARPVVDENLH